MFLFVITVRGSMYEFIRLLVLGVAGVMVTRVKCFVSLHRQRSCCRVQSYRFLWTCHREVDWSSVDMWSTCRDTNDRELLNLHHEAKYHKRSTLPCQDDSFHSTVDSLTIVLLLHCNQCIWNTVTFVSTLNKGTRTQKYLLMIFCSVAFYYSAW